MEILIAMIFGFLSGSAIEHQKFYCECYRSDFRAKHCKEIKGEGLQGTCYDKQE